MENKILIKTTLSLILTLFLAAIVQAQVEITTAGPRFTSKIIASYFQEGKWSEFTDEESREIAQIELFPDNKNEKVFYYVPPVVVSKWSENRYSLNLEVQERLQKALLLLAELDLTEIQTLVRQVMEGADNAQMQRQNNSIIEAFEKIKNDEIRSHFLNMVQKMQALLPSPYSALPIRTAEEAFLLTADILNKVPSIRAQVSLGLGFTKVRASALDKLKKLNPSYSFYAIPPRNSFILQPLKQGPSISNPSDIEGKIAQKEYSARTKFNETLFSNVMGTSVTTSGGVLGIDLYFNLARGWNYSKDNPSLGAGEMSIEGEWRTTFPMSAKFNGTVTCDFQADVIYNKIFSVDQIPDTVLLVDTSTDIENTQNSIVRCDVYDSAGKLLSNNGVIEPGQIDPSLLPPGISHDQMLKSLNAQIEDKIAKFTEENSVTYRAATSMVEALQRQATSETLGYLNLNVPLKTAYREKWETNPVCRELPQTTDECVRHGWKKGHRIKSLGDQWVCKEYRVITVKECEDVQRLRWEAYHVPVKVKGFKKSVAFEKRFKDSKTYIVSAQQEMEVTVTTKNDACIRRLQIDNPTPNRIADFVSCDGASQADASQRVVNDLSEENSKPQDPRVNEIVFY